MNEDRWFVIVLLAVAIAWIVGGYVSASPLLARWIERYDEKGRFSGGNITTAMDTFAATAVSQLIERNPGLRRGGTGPSRRDGPHS